jgi:malate synthase
MKIKQGNLQIEKNLYDFINDTLLKETTFSNDSFWKSFEHIIDTLTPINTKLLEKREELQSKIDEWHQNNSYDKNNIEPYKTFLQEIGYIQNDGGECSITTRDVDEEIKLQAGPQLVVPVKNARFALNASNARWGSLYDALYGTDVISKEGETAITKEFNPKRALAAVTYAKEFLDKVIPLENGSYKDVADFDVVDGKLEIVLQDGTKTKLQQSQKFEGYKGKELLVFKNNNLHIQLLLDSENYIAKLDNSPIKDVVLEGAITTIMDCEDSVAAVDGEDKLEVYKNWYGLIKGDLEDTFMKNGSQMTRKLNDDIEYISSEGKQKTLHGRSLLFVRNVGHLMQNPAILDKNGNEIFEGIMDCMITVLASVCDIKGNNTKSNSRTKSIYIVKPKMHGSDEVAFAVKTFEMVEDALALPSGTIKIGIMDEERRTTINLKECIRAASDRVVFINTGFLDRTGDEIHTSMMAGAFVPKSKMKEQTWIGAYENWNVDIGLECGLQGKAQIGKGMWAMPDEMAKMMVEKIAHPKAGVNTAWVPSPTAAVLHSSHYHLIDIIGVQNELKGKRRASLDELITLPLLDTDLDKETIKNELQNNAQGILGYVVRWVDQGVGCSKVPDIHDVGLMEDRATLRISSQHLANWIEHKICTKDEVLEALKEMAVVVDKQNIGDPLYKNMAPSFDGYAFRAACDLVFEGKTQPSGYTEPLLHGYRRKILGS